MKLGLTPRATGADAAIVSANATRIEICIFDASDRELRRLPLPQRTGDVFHGHLPDLPLGTRYGLRAHGPYAPHEGHRFNPAKLLIDPHATTLDRIPRLHPSMLGEQQGRADPTDSAPHVPKAIFGAPENAPSDQLTPWSETIIYELHVAGFTRRHPAIPPELRGTFAGLAHPASIAHLQTLGITAVEILPAAAWIEEPHLAARNLTNYWGYNPIAFCAPDPRLAPGGWPEIRAATKALAAAGIETIVDVVLNHSGEGDALGPTLSLRGLDNSTYYRLQNDPAAYGNDSGCGNTLALDRPHPLRLAMDALRAWALHGGIHGFRFDLAPVLGRRPAGFDPEAPLLAAIDQDPVLSALKLIAEPWDIGPGGHRTGQFPPPWGEWNDSFRDATRRYWRGDPNRTPDLATALAGSFPIFAAKRRPSRSINFVAAHDGFTLADLTAYATKHNQANAEDNRDGTDDNFSWNHGAEGPTDDPAILAARTADQRALLATLLLARGTPMLSMGAERGFSQSGNNNAYCQDSPLSWLDWEHADPTLTAWTTQLIALRRAHPALRADHFLTAATVAWHAADGSPFDWQDAADPPLVMLLDDTAIVVNRTPVVAEIILPAAAWTLAADSAAGPAPARALAEARVTAAPRSILLLIRSATPTPPIISAPLASPRAAG